MQPTGSIPDHLFRLHIQFSLLWKTQKLKVSFGSTKGGTAADSLLSQQSRMYNYPKHTRRHSSKGLCGLGSVLTMSMQDKAETCNSAISVTLPLQALSVVAVNLVPVSFITLQPKSDTSKQSNGTETKHRTKELMMLQRFGQCKLIPVIITGSVDPQQLRQLK